MMEEIEELRLQAKIHLLKVLLATHDPGQLKSAADACQYFSYTK